MTLRVTQAHVVVTSDEDMPPQTLRVTQAHVVVTSDEDMPPQTLRVTQAHVVVLSPAFAIKRKPIVSVNSTQRYVAPPAPPPTTILDITEAAQNLNMRALYDIAHPSPPAVGETVILRIGDGVVVDSADTATPSIVLGDWSDAALVFRRIEIAATAKVSGKPGAGGNGGSPPPGVSPSPAALWNGHPGLPGGDAIEIDALTTIDNLGTIEGGAGGGGGGASVGQILYFDVAAQAGGGGGGGGGQGEDGSAKGEGGASIVIAWFGSKTDGADGTDGTAMAAGAGGAGGQANGIGTHTGGAGGAGGAPGMAGSPGLHGSISGGGGSSVRRRGEPGAGGQPGAAIRGNSLVAWENEGTIVGPQVP